MSAVEPMRTTSQPCQVHGKHIPASHVNHFHHVWPLGEGGPDVPENKVTVCPTGHYNIHDLLREYKVRRGQVPYNVLRRYSFKEREIAQLGWDRMRRGEL